MEMDNRFSRPSKTAESLGEDAADRHRFLEKRVLLTGECDALSTSNGREAFFAALRLLPRFCQNVSVSLPPSLAQLKAEAQDTAQEVTLGTPISFVESPDLHLFHAILSIGVRCDLSLPMTAINSNGWLVRVTSVREQLGGPMDQTNPIGAVAAACLGASEVFKRLIALRPERGALLDEPGFSFYSFQRSTEYGPDLPEEIMIDGLLVGGGAIGNGVGYLLSRLRVSGRLDVVDAQVFQSENLGTCILIGQADLGKDKAAKIVETLQGRMFGEPIRGTISDVVDKLGKEVPYPRIVLSALDNIEARHQVQRLWPDLVIDGAIGEFLCQASRHPWGENVACLMCLFREPEGERAERRASRLTGLKEGIINDAEAMVSQADVEAAPGDRRAWLNERIGRKICSVVHEAVAQEISSEAQREGFRPSVPFVACLSACMMVGELVKRVAGWTTLLEPRFQLDLLRGPAQGTDFPQARRSDCSCTQRRGNIETFRRSTFGAN